MTNSSNLDPTQPCLPCPAHCLLCSNASFCLACDLETYLTAGSCFAICSSNQVYKNNTCSASSSSLFDQSGRLGYDFGYLTDQSLINFTLTFSQKDVLFYYFENETGFAYSSSQSSQSQSSSSVFFFDDGNQNSAGFQSSSAAQTVPSVPIGSLSGNSSQTFANGPQFDFSLIKTSDLKGSYLGISEQYYYYLTYFYYQQRTGISARYTDKFGIPYGKVNLTSNPPVANPCFLNALSENLVVVIGNDTIQYKIVAASSTVYYVTAALTRSYYG